MVHAGGMKQLLFLIRSLDRGGAERQLIELAKGLDKARFAVTVCTFYDGGALRPDLERVDGVKVISLHKANRWDLLPFLWRLWKTVRRVKPHIIHGYMGVANELSLLMGRAVGAKVAWGIRASNMDLSQYDWASRCSFRVGGWLSRFTDLMIVNSQAGKEHHVAHGYSGKLMIVIPNGIDIQRFRPDPAARQRVRAEWAIADDQILIGLVGRLDPMKDHPNFLKGAASLAREREETRFVCVGGGAAAYQQELQQFGNKLGLRERLVWAGARDDMPAIYNALDVASSSSSYGEGFPNVIGEAMACGVPCVVTDVGDSAWIVGKAGVVVRPKDAEALARGWKQILAFSASERAKLSILARQRITTNFTREQLMARTQQALLSLYR